MLDANTSVGCFDVQEEMVKRPDMRTVLFMLEGREPVPDPSQSRPTVSYDFRFYESNVR